MVRPTFFVRWDRIVLVFGCKTWIVLLKFSIGNGFFVIDVFKLRSCFCFFRLAYLCEGNGWLADDAIGCYWYYSIFFYSISAPRGSLLFLSLLFYGHYDSILELPVDIQKAAYIGIFKSKLYTKIHCNIFNKIERLFMFLLCF